MHTMIQNDLRDKSYAVGCYVHHHPGGAQDFQTIAVVKGMIPENNARVAASLVSFLNGGDAQAILNDACDKGFVKFL